MGLTAGVVGSQARGSASACSDVDLIILVREPAEFIRATEWIEAFGHPLRHAFENCGNVEVCRVWYQHGLEVEFGFADERWAQDPGGQAVIADGLRVLLDRGLLRDHHDGGAAGKGFSNRG